MPYINGYEIRGRPWGSMLQAARRAHGVGRPPALALARLTRLGWRPFADRSRPGIVLWAREPGSKVGPAERRRRRRAEALRADLLNPHLHIPEGFTVSPAEARRGHPLSRAGGVPRIFTLGTTTRGALIDAGSLPAEREHL